MIKLLRASKSKEVCRIVTDPKKSGKKDWDYVKNNYWEISLNRHFQSLSAEKQRIIGSEIYSLLRMEVDAVHWNVEHSAKHFLEGFILASYRFDRFISDRELGKLNAVIVPKRVSDAELKYLNVLQDAVFWTRDMVNLPVSHLNAVQFANEIKNFCQQQSCRVEIWNQAKIKAMKMGGLLAVNSGSITPPTFTIIEYKPPTTVNKRPLVLVGKGVVYDTGGLSLKPTPGSMDSMKSDMAGAAMVVGAIKALSLLEVPVYVIGLIPATDNRPGENAYAPGDVITMYNNSTVEVLNTDAEGRMILADALSYADKFNPLLVLSAATLTGAAVRAIGTKAAIAMGNASRKTMDALLEAGFNTHERLVEFPFWEDYLAPMKSEIADLKNLGGADAGMITAGKFLETFVKAPYIHLDVAGPTWLDQKSGYLPKGGTGFGVRLLLEFITNFHQWIKKKS
ncbi:MAG: leucyl aminopeptidase [Bacteroidetes bacterium]|nr:leucyl aminopeptidase [Bacteroidota bacterium]